MNNVAGIDVSKGKSMVSVLRPFGEVVAKPFSIGHTGSELKELADYLKSLDGETRVVMEHTGRYYEPVARFLHDEGVFVSAVNPKLIKDYGNNTLRKVKTDKADSRKIARYAILSYEAASERCDLSSRYFADIARGKTAPTILTLEKLCVGFDLTPNDLLIPSELWREMAFREPMPVTHIRCFHFFHGLTGFPVCPQCGRTLKREYQPYCDRCGQCLDWKGFSKATIILPQK